MQAALGTTQLRKLDRFVDRREELAGRYDVALADLDVIAPPPAPAGGATPATCTPSGSSAPGSSPGCTPPASASRSTTCPSTITRPTGGTADADLHTEAAYAHLLSLPLFPDLTVDEQDRVIAALGDLL